MVSRISIGTGIHNLTSSKVDKGHACVALEEDPLNEALTSAVAPIQHEKHNDVLSQVVATVPAGPRLPSDTSQIFLHLSASAVVGLECLIQDCP